MVADAENSDCVVKSTVGIQPRQPICDRPIAFLNEEILESLIGSIDVNMGLCEEANDRGTYVV